jgi:phospholipase C
MVRFSLSSTIVSATLAGLATAATAAASQGLPPSAHSARHSRPPIAHIVVVSMENRTPDNLFCTAFPALENPSGYGQPFPGMDLQCPPADPSYWTSLASPFDPGHSYLELVAEWDNGLLDGFANDPVYTISGQQISIPGFAQTVVPPNETPIYSLLAATYVIGDRMFSSGLVPSFPAHQYMFAAQSIASDSPDETPWGCDAPSDALVSTFGPNNTLGPPVYPCFDYASLADLLDAKGVSWKYYTDRPKTVGGNIDAIGAIQQLRFGSDFAKHVRFPEVSVESAMSNCRLPAVSFVNAPNFASDLSGTLSAGGPSFVGGLYLVLAETAPNKRRACRYYDDTALIVTWDDSGGWSDHVAPATDPQTGRPFGLRVPIMVLSPYANHPSGAPVYVAHDTFTFGSIIRYIENTFGLGTLGLQDAEATDLNSGDAGALINYDQPPIPPLMALARQRLLFEIQRAKARVQRTNAARADADN